MSTDAANSPVKKTTATHTVHACREARKFSKLMTTRAQQAKAEGKPVAWVMFAHLHGPILSAMDIACVYTENYAGVCAAKRQQAPFIDRAEAEGYASDICGYARVGLGYSALRKDGVSLDDAPDGGMPEPDMMIGCSSACDPRFKWYEATGHFNNVPCFNYDDVLRPIGLHSFDEREGESLIKYQTKQLHRLVDFVSEQTGKKPDWDRISECYKLHHETHKLWYETYQLRRATPSPMPSQDGFSVFVPHMFLPAEQSTYQFYKNLRDEVKDRVEKGLGVIENEKYRLLWAWGLPPWSNMNLFNYFESKGGVVVSEIPYFPGEPGGEWSDNGGDPIEQYVRLRWLQTTDLLRRSRETGDENVQRVKEFINDYKVDGLIFHATMSCRATTIGQIHRQRALSKHFDLPSLFIQSDIVDNRDYSEAQMHLRIDAFMETVDAHKRRNG